MLLMFLAGVITGGYLFSNTISRSFLAVHACDDQCWRLKDLVGILGSAGIRHVPRLLPFFEVESQHCVAVRHPNSDDPYHITYLPKRDVRNVLELTSQDVPYLLGCLALAREHAAKAGIKSYRLVSNGPSRQHVTYFHFHVIGE
ncbi:MAG: HIT domain-containing protein [Luteimonas sp.]|nr:HIT domain-containing protein [Luteimonas sp.]